MPRNVSVVLFNLGGPDSPRTVQSFLFNLFNDRYIIRLPNPLRFLLAMLISKRRAPKAQKNYAHLGEKYPLLQNTIDQAQALSQSLKSIFPEEEVQFSVHVGMRYWHPFFSEILEKLKKSPPDLILFLPLYPQFSSTTTLSFYENARELLKKHMPTVSHQLLCCYPEEPGFIDATFDLIKPVLAQLSEQKTSARILLSAHGLPEKIVKAGDPYADHLALTMAQLKRLISKHFSGASFDISLCYQSRVGPLQWLKPSTESALSNAARDGIGVVLVPISFVSEHLETLVELDIEYADLANELGLPFYHRIPTVSCHPRFIEGLARFIGHALAREERVSSFGGKRICAIEKTDCPYSCRS
jgi:ferrochelatase